MKESSVVIVLGMELSAVQRSGWLWAPSAREEDVEQLQHFVAVGDGIDPGFQMQKSTMVMGHSASGFACIMI